MRNARQICLWHPTGPAVSIGALLVLTTAAVPGCGDDETTPAQTTTTTTTTTGEGGSGGSGGSSQGVALTACQSDGARFSSPFDATPDPDGTTVYFTAISALGEAAVFKAPCGGAIATLAEGDPLVAPFNIATSTDGNEIYVADPAAEDDNDLKGAIFRIPSDGGTPVAIPGTVGTMPRGLEVRAEGGADEIWFTGVDPADGLPGVFKIATAAGALEVVAKGAPFRDPSGIALTADGTAYVTDTDAAGNRMSTFFEVKAGVPLELISGLEVGYPAGVAVTTDGQTLYVSGIDAVTQTDAVFVVNIASQGVMSFTMGLESFTEAAGLHRAKNADVFAWSDASAQGSGTVYILQ